VADKILYQTIDNDDALVLNYSRAFERLDNSAIYRKIPEHFKVYETLSFTPVGFGDHLYLHIEKTNCNTEWLARELAELYNLKYSDVGYAGRKDRFAVTQQWFSLHLPESKPVNLELFSPSEYKILEHSRHTHKLRKGEIKVNKFQIQLTDFDGSYEELQQRVSLITEYGFPNYFGPQRFGHGGKNVEKAAGMLSGTKRVKDRNKRSIYLSAARSFIFNQILKIRLEQNNWLEVAVDDQFWDHQIAGLLDVTEFTLVELQAKVNRCELSICGALVGDRMPASDSVEMEVSSQYTELVIGIRNSRVEPHHRSLRSLVKDLLCVQNDQGVLLEFSLTTGTYATSLLRELIGKLSLGKTGKTGS